MKYMLLIYSREAQWPAMTPEQQKVVAERGNLAGPWVPLSRSPEVQRNRDRAIRNISARTGGYQLY